MRMLLCIIVAMLLCPKSGADEKPGVGDRPESKSQKDIDKRAFERARKAQNVQTWDAAIAILERIDIDVIDDEEVIEYVEFSRRCSKVANTLGIDRKSDPTKPSSVILEAQMDQLAATLADRLLKGEIGGVIATVASARKIQKGIPRFLELDGKLARRYGTD